LLAVVQPQPDRTVLVAGRLQVALHVCKLLAHRRLSLLQFRS
jgi:hypothetical protein